MVFDWFKDLNPILQAFLATSFNWFLTACGAALVFLFKTINRKVLDGMLGFGRGNDAASFSSSPRGGNGRRNEDPVLIPAVSDSPRRLPDRG
jgi:ZIP family zinc transporter